MANSGTAQKNGRTGPASLWHYLPSAGAANFDIAGYSNTAGNGPKACKRITNMAAVAASGLVIKRQWDDANETFVTLPAGSKLDIEASQIVSSTVDLLIEW